MNFTQFQDEFEGCSLGEPKGEVRKALGSVLKILARKKPEKEKILKAALKLAGYDDIWLQENSAKNFGTGGGAERVFWAFYYWIHVNGKETAKVAEIDRLLLGDKTFFEKARRPVRYPREVNAENGDGQRQADERINKQTITAGRGDSSTLDTSNLDGICAPPSELYRDIKTTNRAHKICYLEDPAIARSNATPNAVDFRFRLSMLVERRTEEELDFELGFKQLSIEIRHANLHVFNHLRAETRIPKTLEYSNRQDAPGIWTVKGPKNDDGVLMGESIGNERLFQAAFLSTRDAFVELSISVRRRYISASVYDLSEEPHTRPESEKEQKKKTMINCVIGLLIPIEIDGETGQPPADYLTTCWRAQW